MIHIKKNYRTKVLRYKEDEEFVILIFTASYNALGIRG